MLEIETDKKRGSRAFVPLPGLRRERQDAGLSMRGLSDLTARKHGKRVHLSAIADLEAGRRGALPRTAKLLADALGVSIKKLREE